MLVRLAKLESKIHESPLELFGQPWACGKAANEKCELFMINQVWGSRISEYTDRVGGKASPEVIPDRVYGRLNRGFEESRNLRAICKNVSAPIHQWSGCEFTQSTSISQLLFRSLDHCLSGSQT